MEGNKSRYSYSMRCRFWSDFDMLRRKGTLVAIGNASGPPDPVSPLKLSAKNLKLVRPK